MDIDLGKIADGYNTRRRKNRIWKKLVSALGCLVVFCTTYALILPAITMERETLCGLPEHVHTESCYAQQDVRALACTKASLGVHTHTAACADESCGYADFVIHKHSAACYDAAGKLVCTLPQIEEHTHSDSCYQTEKLLVGEHTHTDECYTLQRGALTCTLPEGEGHTHSDACKGTKKVLDCKTPETDGHAHGDGCYDAEGNLVCAKEVAPAHHHGDSCYHTEEALVCGKTEYQAHQHTDECYQMEKTLTCGQEEGPIYEAGERVLACGKQEIRAHKHTSACFDSSGNWICGQREILNHTHTDSCFETQQAQVLTCGLEEHTHTDSCYPAETTAETTAAATESQTEETTEATETGPALALMESGLLPMSSTTAQLPNVKMSATRSDGETGADYNPDSNKFETKIHIDFEIPASDFDSDTTYIYDYPEGIEVPDDLLGKTFYLEGNRGTYQFEKEEDGTYRLKVNFPSIAETGEAVTGFVNFFGTVDASNVQKDGSLVVGGDSNRLEIKPDEIHYPDGETEKYDISASKSTDGNIDNGKLTYTVIVSSTKGTPDPITLTDVISTDGLQLGAPTVTVNGQTVTASWDEATGTLTMSNLPGLEAGGSYNIIYTYDVSGYPSMEMNPENKLTVKAKDEDRHQEVTDEKTVSTKIDKSHTATKDGQLENGRIKWTITVNANGTDIAGATLTDEMFDALATGTNISVSPAGGYTLADGKITFTGVNGDKNNQTYTITYYTDLPEDDSVKTVENKATFDPDPDDPDDEIEMVETVGVGLDANKSGTYNRAEGTITWVITVNTKNRDIAGSTLTDDMLSQAIGNIQVSPTDGYKLVTGEDGQVSINFLAVANGENTYTYTITYVTKADPAMVAKTVVNTAHLKKGDIDEEVTAEVKIGSDGSVSKSSGKLTLSEDETTGTLPWTVTIHVPAGGMPEGTVLKDELGDGNKLDMYMTNLQVKAAVEAFCKALDISVDDVEVGISDGIWWSGNTFKYSDIDSYTDVKFRKLTLTLKEDWRPANGEAQDVEVTYDTTLVIDGTKYSDTYYNYFDAGEKNTSGRYDYWRSGVVKTDGKDKTGTTTATSDGSLTWKVTVYLDGTERTLLDIKDTLPDGVTLKKVTMVRPEGTWEANTEMTPDDTGALSGQNSTYAVSGTYDSGTGEISLKVTPASGGILPTGTKLTFIFDCATDITDDEQHSFTNTVEVADIGNTFQTQDWTYDNPGGKDDVLGKTGHWNNDSRMLEYSVTLNPEGKILVGDGSGTLTITDTLTFPRRLWAYLEDGSAGETVQVEASLLQNSVKLYALVQNEDGTTTETELHTPWIYHEEHDSNNGKCILTITGVPDGTPLVLKYLYKVGTSAPDDYVIRSLDIKNEVQLEGTKYSTSSDSFDTKWEKTGTTGQVTSGKSLTIYKVARGDYGEVLQGAEFTVYTVDTSVTPYVFTEHTTRPDGSTFSNPITTNASGLVSVRMQDTNDAPDNYAVNTVYAIRETKAPKGYKLPEDPEVFYFYFSDDEVTEPALPSTLPQGALDLSQTDQQMFVENEPTYELPQTGGAGTRGYMLSGALMTTAGLYLLSRKKRRRRDAQA